MRAVEVRSPMADISMCTAFECPLAKTCFRFLATPSEYQTYFIIDHPTKDCGEYWPVKDEEELKRLDEYWRD